MSYPIITYSIRGKAARLFPFQPNWQSEVNEILEWKTDVIRARNGDEQRRQLRTVPRRSFEYSILTAGEQASMLEAYLWGWQSEYFALPVWTDGTRLQSGVTSGAINLSLGSTAHLGFKADDHAVLFVSPKQFEVVSVLSVSPTGLMLSTGTLYPWPAGTKVMPVMLGHLGTSLQTSRHSGAVSVVGNISFTASGVDADANLPVLPQEAGYDGYEVYTKRPNWQSAIDNTFVADFDTVDTGTGAVNVYLKSPVSRVVRPIEWMLKDRDQMTAFRGFLARLRGQQKTCWLPSWHDDFALAPNHVASSLNLRVKGTWFNGMVGVDPHRDRIMVTYANGTHEFRRIVTMASDYGTDTTVLQLDSVLGTTVHVGDNLQLRLLLKCRLATDKIVIPWHTDSIATPKTSFTTVNV